MQDRIAEEALSFDDVLMLPSHSDVLPSDADLSTSLTADIRLKIPVISAAMDTVTEHAMAIAVAKAGGIGVIHKNMTIAEQAAEVRKVKNYEAGVIAEPVAVHPNTPVSEIKQRAQQLGFGSFPVVVPETRKVLGIVTSRDVKHVTDGSLLAQDVMTLRENLVTILRQPRSARGGDPDDATPSTEDRSPISSTINMTRGEVKSLMAKNRVEKIVVVDEDDCLQGLITHGDFIKAEECPHACRDREGRLRVCAAVGCGPDTMDRVKLLYACNVDAVCVDSSHGHSEGVLNTVRMIRHHFPRLAIIAGNVCTGEGAVALADAGANAVKIGVGPGSICTTRVVTGCGCPQLTAIANAAAWLRDRPVPVIADGGLRFSGDIAKALAAGAHCVMLGSMLAGTDEAPGAIELFEGRAYKSYRGMGSEAAMRKGSADRYFQSEQSKKKLVPEGVEGRVPYKGPVMDTLQVQLGGLRAAMGLTGCRTIKDMHTNIRFVRMTGNGVKESHPHSVSITKDAANYSK